MVNAPISIGELFDKITILEIKLSQVKDKDKLKNITIEYNHFKEISASINTKNIDYLIGNLKEVNLTLWNIENNIRAKENLQEFDLEFIEISRSVYKNNDLRAVIKKKINILTDSLLCEEKEHL